MSSKKGLPIGLQSFDRLIKENFIYVDKTRDIYDLTSVGLYYFLARPRRFGKTLLLTTLAELFKGNKELFKDLYISTTKYDWKEHPVVYITFATMRSNSAQVLEAAIVAKLRSIASTYGVTLDESMPTLGMKFSNLIKSLAKKNNVVILIDEYDAPILNTIDDVDVAKECRDVLADFFSAMKDGEVDSYLRFVCITGITKFSKTSIFSGLNNLQDLTLDPRAAKLLGYTAEEINAHYQDYLASIIKKTGQSLEQVLEQIRFWYNGYQFVDPEAVAEPKVYNPYSVMLYLQNQVFDNYWFDTSTPTFFMELLSQLIFPVTAIDGAQIHKSKTKSYDIKKIKLVPLLWQTGYLSIESYNPYTKNYTLTFPNEEVRMSFFENVMEELTSVEANELSSFVNQLSFALKKDNLSDFFEVLQTFFAHIPYDMHIPLEKYYHSIFFSIMKLLGAQVVVEEKTNNGRIDAVLETDGKLYIIEFKLDASAQAALDQIEQKAYYQKYFLQKKPLVLVGVAFDTEKRNIAEWHEKELSKSSAST